MIKSQLQTDPILKSHDNNGMNALKKCISISIWLHVAVHTILLEWKHYILTQRRFQLEVKLTSIKSLYTLFNFERNRKYSNKRPGRLLIFGKMAEKRYFQPKIVSYIKIEDKHRHSIISNRNCLSQRSNLSYITTV